MTALVAHAPIAPKPRPAEVQDWLNARVYHPLSRRVAAALAATPVTPNMVSMVGAAMVMAAAAAYVGMAAPWGWALGFVLHLGWHVVDGADGDLARLTGRASPIGEIVDGACDYAGHAVLYIALAAALATTLGWPAWALAVAAAASHIVQTNHAESQKRSYLWWAYGVPWLKVAKAPPSTRLGTLLHAPIRAYLALAGATNRSGAAIDAAFARAAGDVERTRRMREAVRARGRALLALPKLTGANPRTLLLGASMASGTPLWFFLAQIVLLNLLLVAAVIRQRSENRTIAAQLARL